MMGVALLAAAAAVLGLGQLCVDAAGEAAAGGWHELDPLVVTLTAGCAGLVLAWLTLGAAASTVQLARGARRPTLSPRLVHRLVGGALGVGLTLTPVMAQAATADGPIATASASAPTSPDPSRPAPVDPGWGAAPPSEPGPGTSSATHPAPTASAAPTSAPTTAPSSGPSSSTGPARVPKTQQPTAWPSHPAEPSAAGDSSTVRLPDAPKAGTPADGAWLPAVPTPAPPTAQPADPIVVGAPRPEATQRQEVVVVRGDCLWSIAERHLPAGASAADVAREWPRWYEANRAVIGADPDLILPGQRLLAPG